MEACAATATIRQYRKPKWRLPFNVMMRAGERRVAEPLLIRLQEPAKTSSCQSATFFWQAREELYWEPNPMSRADEFRKNADECRQRRAHRRFKSRQAYSHYQSPEGPGDELADLSAARENLIPRAFGALERAEQAGRRERCLRHLHSKWCQGVVDRIENHRRWRDGAALAHALDAELGVRRWRVHVKDAHRRDLGRSGHEVIRQR